MERLVSAASGSPPAEAPALPAARSFHLAMTPFPHDSTLAAVEAAYAAVATHCDMITQHFDDGVPWPEAYAGTPYAAGALADIDYRAGHRPPGHRLYLAVTPISVTRDGLAPYRGDSPSMPRPGAWADRDFDSPEVLAAYLNHCRYMIGRFSPDYFAYGVEANILRAKNPAAFAKYVEMSRQVYAALKKEYPELPIFITVQAEVFHADPVNQAAAIGQLMQYSDYVAVSSYPYWMFPDPADLPADWFSRLAALAPGKPFAIAETGFIAEDLVMTDPPVSIPGSAARQNSYLGFLLERSAALDARFVNWFLARDYDQGWSHWGLPEWMKEWKDIGLIDGDGNARPSLAAWDAWKALPVAPVLATRLTGLTISCRRGQSPPAQAFDVWNSGGGTLGFAVSADAVWLSCSPNSGSSAGPRQPVTVTYSTAGLAAGSYAATITVTAPGAVGSPQTIPVSLTVTKPSGGGGGGGGCSLAGQPGAAGDACGWLLPYLALAGAWLTLRTRGRLSTQRR
jgi:hypothetical protein